MTTLGLGFFVDLLTGFDLSERLRLVIDGSGIIDGMVNPLATDKAAD